MQDFEEQLKDAYFAGLIDGEGYVGLEPNNRSKSKASIQKIVVGMTCPETISALQQHFNCGAINIRKPTHLGYKMQYYWYVSHRNARFVAERVLPYLITKKEAAIKLLEYIPVKVDIPRDTKGRFTLLAS